MGKKGIRIRDINHLKEIFEKSSFDVRGIFLFGSRARGDFLDESDWDIVLVSPDFTEIPFPERATYVLKNLPLRRVELLCYTPEEFHRMQQEGNSFIQEVVEFSI